MLTALWVVGITAEGMTGALAAGRARMDLFGVIMVALVTALGGGSIRDVLLGNYPLTWVAQPKYVLLIVVAAIITVSIARMMKYFRPIFLALDGLGLIVFAILGAQIALGLGFGVIIACVAAVVTGVAGGILRDLLCDRIPLVFHEELYASIAIVAALLYVGQIHFGVPEQIAVIVTLVIGFGMRMLALQFRWRLPVFDYQESYYDTRKAIRMAIVDLKNRRLRRHGPEAPDDGEE